MTSALLSYQATMLLGDCWLITKLSILMDELDTIKCYMDTHAYSSCLQVSNYINLS